MKNYPPTHFKQPDGEILYFKNHVPSWTEFVLPFLQNKPNVCLEIGSLFGAASVFILDNLCEQSGSKHYIFDINENEYLLKNLEPYNNVELILGESCNSFRNFQHDGMTKEFLDFVYIDGNHTAKYVLEDAVNSFYYLKPGGILVFDDYGWGHDSPIHERPKTGIDAFIVAYEKYLSEIYMGWQVILMKDKYEPTLDETNSNYYTNYKHTTKQIL